MELALLLGPLHLPGRLADSKRPWRASHREAGIAQYSTSRPGRRLPAARNRGNALVSGSGLSGIEPRENGMSGARVFNGVDGRTGRYLPAPETEEEFARRIRDEPLDAV